MSKRYPRGTDKGWEVSLTGLHITQWSDDDDDDDDNTWDDYRIGLLSVQTIQERGQ